MGEDIQSVIENLMTTDSLIQTSDLLECESPLIGP